MQKCCTSSTSMHFTCQKVGRRLLGLVPNPALLTEVAERMFTGYALKEAKLCHATISTGLLGARTLVGKVHSHTCTVPLPSSMCTCPVVRIQDDGVSGSAFCECIDRSPLLCSHIHATLAHVSLSCEHWRLTKYSFRVFHDDEPSTLPLPPQSVSCPSAPPVADMMPPSARSEIVYSAIMTALDCEPLKLLTIDQKRDAVKSASNRAEETLRGKTHKRRVLSTAKHGSSKKQKVAPVTPMYIHVSIIACMR